MHRADFGLGGCLCTFLSAFNLSLKTNRQLILDFRGYRYGGENLFSSLFSYPKFSNYTDVKDNIKTVFPTYFTDYLDCAHSKLTKDKKYRLDGSCIKDIPIDNQKFDCLVITRDDSKILMDDIYYKLAKDLVVHPIVKKYIDDNSKTFKQYKKVIGVHFRHGNGEQFVVAPKLSWYVETINNYLIKNNLNKEEVLIYLGTDCLAVFQSFKKIYPNIKQFNDKGDYSSICGDGAVHINHIRNYEQNEKVDTARIALADMYLLSMSDLFIGGKDGYFVKFILLLRNKKQSIIDQHERYYRNYNFNDMYYPIINDNVLKQYFIDNHIPTDGLFVKIENNVKYIYYYYDLMGFTNTLECDNMDDIYNNILHRRLY